MNQSIHNKENQIIQYRISSSPAAGCNAGYVADKWQHAQQTGLFLSEDEARYYFRQFVTAVAYCHAHNVAHRCSPHCRALQNA